MPSTRVMVQSGGMLLTHATSGSLYSGSPFLQGGIQLKLQAAAPGPIYVSLPNLSGTVGTFNSGGSATSGNDVSLTDGLELSPGEGYFVPKTRLVSGVCTPLILAAATSSGGLLMWEPM